MARIAKRKLTEQHLHQLFDQLAKTIAGLSSVQIDSFLGELLGPEEKIMVAKRLAIIIMIREGYSLYRIAMTLFVSAATAEKIKKRYDSGAYMQLIKLLQKNKIGYMEIIEMIDSLLQLGGILPRYGQHHKL